MNYPKQHIDKLKEIVILPLIEKSNLDPKNEKEFWIEFNKTLKENYDDEYKAKQAIAKEFHFNEFEEYTGKTKNQFYNWFTSVFRNSYLKLLMEGEL